MADAGAVVGPVQAKAATLDMFASKRRGVKSRHEEDVRGLEQ